MLCFFFSSRRRHTICALVTGVQTCALPISQDAQDSSLEESYQGRNDIIVTATRRSESVLDVPISIAVLTADEIGKRGLVSAEDYLRGIPGVNQTSDPVGSSIIIRGLETSPSFQIGRAHV